MYYICPKERRNTFMINYRQGKKRYKPNILGSLYIDETKLNNNERPIIYIGGQMEHRCHILEQTGYTADPGHNMFTGSWFYDYPLFSNDKASYNTANFTTNLLTALEEANLTDVALITESYGGLIAAEATKSDRIATVIAIHPPIIGTPLANPRYVAMYKKLLTNYQKLLLQGLKLLINPEYGFEIDNFKGADLTKVDLDKLIVVGNYLDIPNEQNALLKETYQMIKIITGYHSDGVVAFDPEEFEHLGINYHLESKNNNHFAAGTKENIEEAAKLILK